MEIPNDPVVEGNTQADFIREEMNFGVDQKDPMTKAMLEDHPEDQWIDILGNGQLKKKVVKSGKSGLRPNRSDMCTLKIIGKLDNGTVVEEHDEITIQLGDVEVIQGLDLAIALMDVEEVAEVEVASRFAYGTVGRKPDIPPGATIFYTVELKSVTFEEEQETLTITQRKEFGNRKRERGNWWFSRDESTLAIQCYRRALDYLVPEKGGMSNPEDEVEESTSDADLQALLEDRMKVYNNLAAAQIKTQAYEAALKSVENVLRCQPQNVKALFRKAKILKCKGEHALAVTTLTQAAKLDPDSKKIQQELSILKEKSAKDARHEKNLYRKMLGIQKESVNSNSKVPKDESGKSKTSSKIVWSLLGGVTAAVIGVVAYRFAS